MAGSPVPCKDGEFGAGAAPRRALRLPRLGALAALGVVLVVALAVALPTRPARADDPRDAAIVMDAVTGEVFHQFRADVRLYPASLTKMMTLYMTFQALDDGRLTLGQRIPVSRAADAQPPSHLGLAAGSSIRVEDAIYALVTKSANDVAVVLAEAIGGTESGFAEMMTAQARRLGMASTTFRNASGLPDSGQKSTARDMARLARALIWNFPDRYRYFSTERWSYAGATYRNHNRLLGQYDGMDGLKTGYIRASGFNLAASVVRGNLRVVAVVFGGDTSDTRNRWMTRILDEAFATGRARQLMASGELPFRPPRPGRPSASALLLAGVTSGPAAADPIGEKIARTVPGVAASGTPAPAWAAYLPTPPRRPGTGPRAKVELSAAGGTATGVPLDLVPEPPAPPAELASAVIPPEAGGDIPDSGTGGAWGIQVGAYATPEDGRAVLDLARGQAPDLLAGAKTVVMAVETADGPLYRARLTGLGPDSAVLACRRLTEAGTACIPLAPDAGF
ncbi:MAG: D-alanyl-D-alanine carboxypeptidase family protein [Azospirillaceae bacterium]